MKLILRHDMRSAPFGASHQELFAAALDQCVWSEKMGFDLVMTHEHHTDDGYIPAPITFAAAIAGRTRRVRIQVLVAILPLYHPLRLAENLAVLDLVSEGRADVVLGLGYRPAEYEMFGVDFKKRGRLLDHGIEVLKQAWTGEPFDYRGIRVQVTPRPFRKPRPPIILGGNSVPAALRAARVADGFIPPGNPEILEIYLKECIRLGREPGEAELSSHKGIVAYVTEDPDKDWERIGPYLLYANNTYSKFVDVAKQDSAAAEDWPYRYVATVNELKALKSYLIVTPEECVQLAREKGFLMMQPLTGGIPPALAWESLRLCEEKVIPALH